MFFGKNRVLSLFFYYNKINFLELFFKMNSQSRNKTLDLIKVIAIFSMVVDHLRYVLPEYQNILVTFGRWAFPLFAFLIATNTYRAISSNKSDTIRRYFINLSIFSIISEIPYRLLVGSTGVPATTLNVIPTLLIGFLIIILIENKTSNLIKLPTLITILIGLYFFGNYLEYGIFGVLLIVAFYLSISSKTNLKYNLYFIISGVLALLCSLQYFVPIFKVYGLFNVYTMPISLSIILAIFFLRFIDNVNLNINVFKIGKIFWWFYPVHMLLIFLVGSL